MDGHTNYYYLLNVESRRWRFVSWMGNGQGVVCSSIRSYLVDMLMLCWRCSGKAGYDGKNEGVWKSKMDDISSRGVLACFQ